MFNIVTPIQSGSMDVTMTITCFWKGPLCVFQSLYNIEENVGKFSSLIVNFCSGPHDISCANTSVLGEKCLNYFKAVRVLKKCNKELWGIG